MAKARTRTSTKKIKDKWKSKGWYAVLAPPTFDSVQIADTLSDGPSSMMGRVAEISLQDLTNDFRKSHIKLFFRINKVEETNAYTQFVGHTLTSDYLRRMIRRRKSKVDGVYDITTRDGAVLRVKPFATTDKRIQNSQKKVVREAMKKTLFDQGTTSTLSEFVKAILDGKTGSDIYKNCKGFYPVKRIEIYKSEVVSPPTIIMEDKKPEKKEEPQEVAEPEAKEKKKTKKAETELAPEGESEVKEEVSEEKPKEKEKIAEAPKGKTEKKAKAKKPAKKTEKKETKPKTKPKKAVAKKNKKSEK
jgi:small subunit ribosomal protein S3Ae